MQVIQPVEINDKFSISGIEVMPIVIRTTSIVKMVTFESKAGQRFKANQWPDGAIYRITKH